MAKGDDHYDMREWFNAELSLSDSTRKVLEDYGEIPSAQVLSHVYAIREKAWTIHPYPCIGQGRFLDLSIGQHELYQAEILPRMMTGEQTYLDLGCAFAQNVRRLVADGVDSSKCYGADLRLDFIEIGYELFQDKETLKSHFIAADIFDSDSPLKELEGKIDFVDASSFFHLFDLADQKRIARSVIKLMKPRKDSLVVGRQVGDLKAGEYPRRNGQGTRYRHSIESWREMWSDVGGEIGVQFHVEGSTRPAPASRGMTDRPDSAIMMEFSVRRLG
ncbi:hypothetical protein LTR36_001679 [Oleoguttula mirabilis]|uniref:Methyltransferase domain-containing protein n=1 Tax=Oleoguttula mirabilis TaxID=1507867 RepID=A0AAV9JN23_9PEZI|nr:hypothetical protein LTR36_001679 [Oleoguttula mirabilis]